MKAVYRNFIITFLISAIVGCSATLLIAGSENGYAAGFIVLPLLFLFGVVSLILLITGFICLGLEKKIAPWLLLSAVLLPAGFISSAISAKYFEIGAYRQEPMVSFSDEADNVVLFKTGTTNEQIENFWDNTLSFERADGQGREHLSGVRTMTRIQPQNGREGIAFGFFPNATKEQKQIVFTKIKSSSVVDQLIENQLISD